MSTAAERTRRRHRLVTDVLEDVDRRGPAALASWDEPVKSEYGDDGVEGLLSDVWARWRRTFEARLDGVLETADPADLPAEVTRLWRAMSAEFPGSRMLLDAHADDPGLARVQARHARLLRAATGVDLADLQDQPYESRHNQGDSHGTEHRARRRRLRVRPVCPRLHRGPLSAA
jgi:hypothetical protein